MAAETQGREEVGRPERRWSGLLALPVRLVWAGWFTACLLFASRPTPLRQLAFAVAGLALMVLLFGSTVAAIVRLVRGRGLSAVVPTASLLWILVGGAAGVWVGQQVRYWGFRWNLDRYQMAAAWVERSAGGASSVELPDEWSDLAYKVWVSDDEECGRTIEFMWGSGFPAKHVSRVFSRSNALDDEACRESVWGREHRLDDGWYEVWG